MNLGSGAQGAMLKSTHGISGTSTVTIGGMTSMNQDQLESLMNDLVDEDILVKDHKYLWVVVAAAFIGAVISVYFLLR